jgi:hypothetical protein
MTKQHHHNDDIPEQIQKAFNQLPENLEPDEIVAVIITLAQVYTPTKQHALGAILTAAMTLRDLIGETTTENQTTKH